MRQMRARRRAAGLKPVVAWLPVECTGVEEPPGVYSTHRLHDARSLAMHVLIAQKIDRDPGLLEMARRNLARWRQRTAPGHRPGWMVTWSALLRRPWPEIAARLTALTEDGARLRQSTPFAGVLTPTERRRIHDAFRA